MGRINSIGWELQSATANVESTGNSNAVQTTTVRSGSVANQITSLVSTAQKNMSYQFAAAAGNGPYYFRIYYRIDTLPSAENRTIMVNDTNSFTTPVVYITIDNTGLLKLYDEDGQITGTTTILTSTWYCIEILVDATGAGATDTVTARVDGVDFATSSTRNLSTGIAFLFVGLNLNAEAQTTGNLYTDDIAINDNSGSFQNSWPGEGEVIHLKPNADTATEAWTVSSGVDSFAVVDEVTPNDVTDFISKNSIAGTTDLDLEATPAAMDSNDTINCVQVGVRFNTNSTAGTNPIVVVRAILSGTAEESANITFNTTTWNTNAVAAPRNYPLTLYDLPGGSTTAWTKSDLDSAQVGVRLTNASTGLAQVSTLWLLVDHKPAAGGGGGAVRATAFMTTNTGFWGS